jgi:hypothetical protein
MGDPTSRKADSGNHRPIWFLSALAAIVGIVIINTGVFGQDRWRAGEFVTTLFLMTAAVVGIGFALNGRAAGLVVDNRNRVSLSKFQMLVWTILVVSALVTLAACRIRLLGPDPLAIIIPGELLAAMGIAATSFVAAPTVLSLKAAETPTEANMTKAKASAQAQGGVLDSAGKVQGRTNPAQAQWMDMFRGDEVGNSDSPDLSKIQQFAITLLLVGVYISALIQDFGNTSAFENLDPKNMKAFPNALPALSTYFIGLMGLSHASYLVYKAAPHTSNGSPSNGAGQSQQNATGAGDPENGQEVG